MDYLKKYAHWCNSKDVDENDKLELKSLENNDSELKERFIKDLEFGTGGLRGIIGVGTNRINKYTIRKTTQGFAQYIKKD